MSGGCDFDPSHAGPCSQNTDTGPCPDCRDGRRVVSLCRECPTCKGGRYRYAEKHNWPDWDPRMKDALRIGWPLAEQRFDVVEKPCPDCRGQGRVLVGRGSIEVVPVVKESPPHEVRRFVTQWGNGTEWLLINRDSPSGEQVTQLGVLDPLPVPGRDFGIVINCVELT